AFLIAQKLAASIASKTRCCTVRMVVFEAGLMLAVSLGRKMLLRSQKSAPYTLLLRSGFSASWRALPLGGIPACVTESMDGLRASIQNGRMVGRPTLAGLKLDFTCAERRATRAHWPSWLFCRLAPTCAPDATNIAGLEPD